MDMDVIIVILSLCALGLSIYSIWRVGLVEELLLVEVQDTVTGLRSHIDAELEPLTKNVNRAFGFKSEQAVQARQLKKAEGMIIQDVLDTQDPIIMGILDMVSPATSEYLKDHPNLIVDLIPRLQALREVEGFSILDILKPPQDRTSGSSSRRYMREE